VKAIDAALTALDEARVHLEQALRMGTTIRRNSSASRNACSHCARRPQIQCASRRACRARPRYAADLALIDAGAERLIALEGEAKPPWRATRGGASVVGFAPPRRVGARQGGQCRIKPLKLERAQFSTEIESEGEGPTGSTASSSGCAPIPGTRPGPLMKVASGGELARFCSRSKSCWRSPARRRRSSSTRSTPASAVQSPTPSAVRLARLASGVQVIAVTHAPQVAARADGTTDQQDALAKGKRVATRVAELGAERRREEIARMLAGAEITAEARAAPNG